ncbi:MULTISPECIES: ABC transporter permease subunit [unclassified Devosia]|uniref:ABC transporter permease n=1 Tax=unclassified Devosia TaxID=196773 RepID=UPI000AE84FA9|nr:MULTISPECIES: ABC transporter permease subunit [unclassified Devosia]MBN9306583.1 ABC transporter permease subunit [Devosia sp.]
MAAAKRRWTLPSFGQASFVLAFLGIPLAIYIIFVILPIVQAFYYSLTDWGGFSRKMNFVGFDNYLRLLQDGVFLKALSNNLVLALVLPPLTIVLSLTLATLVTVGGVSRGEVRGIANSGIYRIVSFFPYVVPAIVIGIIWAQMYDPSNGLLNGLLTGIGLSGFKSFPWLGDERTAMGASIFVIVWSMVGFYMVLFIAAIKGIPSEVYDAARVDGAGRFRTAVFITVPMIRDNIRTAYIYLGILALDAFVYMQALNSNGGPNNSTLTISQDLLVTAFKKTKFGYASSMGVVMAVVTLLFAALVFLVFYLTGEKKPPRTKSVSPVTEGRRPVNTSPMQPLPKLVRKTPSRPGIWTDKTVATISHVALIAWMIIVCAPLLWVLLSSFKTTKEVLSSPFTLPANWNFDNYVSAWTSAGIGTYFFNSVIVVASALVIVMLLGAMCAYVLARYEFKGNKIIYYAMLAGLTFPPFLAIVPLFFVLQSFHVLNTLQGLIITYVAFALPFTVFFLYAFFRTLPQEVAEAAALDGCGPWRIFFQIMLPMAKPGLASVAIFNFLGLWNQFLLPVALNTKDGNYVLSQGMAKFASQAGYAVDFGALFAAVVITVLPVLVAYIVFQRQLQGSVSPGLLK